MASEPSRYVGRTALQNAMAEGTRRSPHGNRPRSAPIFSSADRQLFGLDAEIAQKLEAKRDQSFEKKTLAWFFNAVGHDVTR